MPDSPEPPVEVPLGERPTAHLPPSRPKEPHVRAPVGACDAHVHIVAGPQDFPLWDGRPEDPALGRGFEDWLALYREHLDTLGCTRGVVVQSILYGWDNSVTVEAVRRLGDQFRGVALVTDEVQDHTLDALAHHHMKAVRLNLMRDDGLSIEGARALAPKLAERGMHVQVLLAADRHLADVADTFRRLPVPVVVDHVGLPASGDPDGPGVRLLRELVADGNVWVKLSGLYRFSDPPYADTDALVRGMAEAGPERCLWGSDWPHLMLGNAEMPDAGVLFDAFTRAVEDSGLRQRILVDNPARLYGF